MGNPLQLRLLGTGIHLQVTSSAWVYKPSAVFAFRCSIVLIASASCAPPPPTHVVGVCIVCPGPCVAWLPPGGVWGVESDGWKCVGWAVMVRS